MLRSVMFVALAFSVLAVSSAVPVFAQADRAKREKRAAEIKAKIGRIGTGEKARVKLKLYDDTKYEAYVRETNDTGFVVVTSEGNTHSVPYSDVRSIGGRNLSTGAKLGIGIGIGAGITLLILALIIASND